MKRAGLFTLGAIAAAAAFVAALLLLPAHYGTNDDIGLLWALNGGDGLGRDAFAIFNSRAFNEALFALYGAAPGAPWWGLSLFAVTGAAIAALFALLARAGRAALFVLPAVSYFLTLCVLYANITIATLLLASACLLWMHRASLRGERPLGFWAALAAGFAASLLLRWNVAVGFLVFCLPIALAAAFRSRERRARSPLWPLLAVMALGVAALAADRLAYKANLTPAQRTFLEYETIRNRFHATPAGSEHPATTPEALRAAGWTREDYAFFRAWILHDDALFNTRTLEAFLEANAARSGFFSGGGWSLSRIRDSLAGSKKNLLLLGLALAALALLGAPRRGRHESAHARAPSLGRFVPWMLPAAAGAACVFFLQHRFVERVYVPLFLLALVGALVSGGWAAGAGSERALPTGKARRAALWSVLVLQAGAALYFFAGHARQLRLDREDRAFIAACVEAHAREAHPVMFVNLHPASSLSLEKIHPLRETLTPSLPPILPDGFWTESPRHRAALDRLRAPDGRAFLRAAVGREDIGWVLQGEPVAPAGVLEMWEGYYRRNLGLDVAFEPARACAGPRGRTLTFYRMTAGN